MGGSSSIFFVRPDLSWIFKGGIGGWPRRWRGSTGSGTPRGRGISTVGIFETAGSGIPRRDCSDSSRSCCRRGRVRRSTARISGPPSSRPRAEGRRGSALRGRLSRIDCLESVLVPADSAFGFLMGRDRSRLDEVARELSKEWGRLGFIDVEALRELDAEIGEAFHDAGAGDRWVRLGEALAGGDYETVLRLLLQHNAFVMGARGSDPWVRETRGVVEVRLRDAGGELREREELEGAWVNNYFLNPLKQVVLTLGEK